MPTPLKKVTERDLQSFSILAVNILIFHGYLDDELGKLNEIRKVLRFPYFQIKSRGEDLFQNNFWKYSEAAIISDW